jgi:hypothetical protein
LKTLLQELLALPPEQAAARAASLIDLLGFKNTYALGKHLAEKEAARLQRALALPLVVVRPSLVSAVAVEPYCGFCGNYAGQVGLGARWARYQLLLQTQQAPGLRPAWHGGEMGALPAARCRKG